MIRLATFFAGDRVATGYATSRASDYLRVGEVVICRRRQVTPVEDEETRLTVRQTC